MGPLLFVGKSQEAVSKGRIFPAKTDIFSRFLKSIHTLMLKWGAQRGQFATLESYPKTSGFIHASYRPSYAGSFVWILE